MLLAAGALALSLFFFAPHLWLMRQVVPLSFEWNRALSYLKQCADPFRTDVEPAMTWRFLPQILAWALGLGRTACLVIPWIGVGVLTSACAAIFLRTPGLSPRQAFAGTILVATTAPVICATGWLGINDAWTAAALVLVAFTDSPLGLIAAMLLGPWVDERFCFGLPSALAVRWLRRGGPPPWSDWRAAALAGLSYAAIRIWALRHPSSDPSTTLFHLSGGRVLARLNDAPMGWWMGIRLAAFPLLIGFESVRRRFGQWAAAGALLSLAGPAAVLAILASDNTRSSGIALPWVIYGFGEMTALAAAGPWIALVVALQLATPAAQVSANKIARIDSLPVELGRLVKNPPSAVHY